MWRSIRNTNQARQKSTFVSHINKPNVDIRNRQKHFKNGCPHSVSTSNNQSSYILPKIFFWGGCMILYTIKQING